MYYASKEREKENKNCMETYIKRDLAPFIQSFLFKMLAVIEHLIQLDEKEEELKNNEVQIKRLLVTRKQMKKEIRKMKDACDKTTPRFCCCCCCND